MIDHIKQARDNIFVMYKLCNEQDGFMFNYLGYKCCIRKSSLGLYCGYVGITNKHPYYKKDYNDINISSVEATFSGMFDENKKIWWIGFDRGHYNDVDIDIITGRLINKVNPEEVIEQIMELAEELMSIK